MKKYWIFNVHYFTSSDVGFKSISFALIIFHEQILNFKVHYFPSLDLRFNALSSVFIRFHEQKIEFSKFTSFYVRMLGSSLFLLLKWYFTNKYWIFKDHYFSSSDVGFNAFSSVFIRFLKKILNFQNSLFFQFGCWVQVYFIRLNNISRTNIEFSKFNLFLVLI